MIETIFLFTANENTVRKRKKNELTKSNCLEKKMVNDEERFYFHGRETRKKKRNKFDILCELSACWEFKLCMVFLYMQATFVN